MTQTKKSILAALLVICLGVLFFPSTIFAAGTSPYLLVDGVYLVDGGIATGDTPPAGVTYDDSTKTLTLTNYTGANIGLDGFDLTIEVVGANTLNADCDTYRLPNPPYAPAIGIVDANVTFTGTGTLTVTSTCSSGDHDVTGICTVGPANIIVDGITLNSTAVCVSPSYSGRYVWGFMLAGANTSLTVRNGAQVTAVCSVPGGVSAWASGITFGHASSTADNDNRVITDSGMVLTEGDESSSASVVSQLTFGVSGELVLGYGYISITAPAGTQPPANTPAPAPGTSSPSPSSGSTTTKPNPKTGVGDVA